MALVTVLGWWDGACDGVRVLGWWDGACDGVTGVRGVGWCL